MSGAAEQPRGSKHMKWEYLDKMALFTDSTDGLLSGLDGWINEVGAQGWELVGSTPLIAPNRDGIAYGTIGVHLVFKRPASPTPVEA
jgi:hypothetical protein